MDQLQVVQVTDGHPDFQQRHIDPVVLRDRGPVAPVKVPLEGSLQG